MPDYLLQEDGDNIVLEDGTGALLLEDASLARVSQDAAEVIYVGESDARVSQDVAEVIMQNTYEDVNVYWVDWGLGDDG